MLISAGCDPIAVEDWERSEDFGIFPTGSKPKELLICPSNTSEAFLIPGRAYLFKSPVGWRAQQIWSEVIAYRISKSLDLKVPPAFVAFNRRTKKLGVLIEFFYEYPKSRQTVRLVHGADLLNFLHPRDGIRPHDVATNMRAHRALRLRGTLDWWAKAIAFDTLIGNTDRHTENWGAIQVTNEHGFEYDYAPLYDNGTSLGYQQAEKGLANLWRSAQAMDAFIQAGTHDCGISPSQDGPMPHLTLCKMLVDEWPQAIAAMRSVIRITSDQIAEAVEHCVAFRVNEVFSPERAYFVRVQIEARRNHLARILGE